MYIYKSYLDHVLCVYSEVVLCAGFRMWYVRDFVSVERKVLAATHRVALFKGLHGIRIDRLRRGALYTYMCSPPTPDPPFQPIGGNNNEIHCSS